LNIFGCFSAALIVEARQVSSLTSYAYSEGLLGGVLKSQNPSSSFILFG